jgi:hypothetical protein
MDKQDRNSAIFRLVRQYIGGFITDEEYVDRTLMVMDDYNKSTPAVLMYSPCDSDCMARNHAHSPGQIGHLYVKVDGRMIDVAPCRYCGK